VRNSMARVGDEVDRMRSTRLASVKSRKVSNAAPISPVSAAKGRHANIEQTFDGDALAPQDGFPALPLAMTRRRLSEAHRARARPGRAARRVFIAGNTRRERIIGGRQTAVRADDDRRLGHGADEIGAKLRSDFPIELAFGLWFHDFFRAGRRERPASGAIAEAFKAPARAARPLNAWTPHMKSALAEVA